MFIITTDTDHIIIANRLYTNYYTHNRFGKMVLISPFLRFFFSVQSLYWRLFTYSLSFSLHASSDTFVIYFLFHTIILSISFFGQFLLYCFHFKRFINIFSKRFYSIRKLMVLSFLLLSSSLSFPNFFNRIFIYCKSNFSWFLSSHIW